MRTGVFGGSFDPPHNGHLALCLLAFRELRLDRLLLSLSRNPFKTASCASDAHRLGMASLLVAEINRSGGNALLDTWEIERDAPSYTVELLRRLRREYPDDELFLIVGEDSYRDMPEWRECGHIPELSSVAVFGRPHLGASGDAATPEKPLPARFVDFDMPVSATVVRSLLAKKEPVSHLLPRAIADYIEANGLYR